MVLVYGLLVISLAYFIFTLHMQMNKMDTQSSTFGFVSLGTEGKESTHSGINLCQTEQENSTVSVVQ